MHVNVSERFKVYFLPDVTVTDVPFPSSQRQRSHSDTFNLFSAQKL